MARFSPDRREPDLRRLFEWLDDEPATGGTPPQCAPPMDVIETGAGLEVILDLPGVPHEGLRVQFSSGVLAITGQKPSPPCEHREAAFHLAERSFGRFTRVIRLAGAFDAARARATLSAGELHVVLPRIEERRGRRIDIRVELS